MSVQTLAVSANGRPLCPVACPSSQGLEDIMGEERGRGMGGVERERASSGAV